MTFGSKFLVACAMLAAAAPALAQPPALFISPAGEPFRGPQGLAAWFGGADADHDGAVTRAEFLADHVRAFRLFDEKADGAIDGFDVSRYEQTIAPEILARNDRPTATPDRPGQGRAPPVDTTTGPIYLPDPNDPDMDPRDRQRVRDRIAEIRMDQAQAYARNRPDNGQRRSGAGLYGLVNEAQPLRVADLDFDYKVSPEEWAASAGRRFTLLDANKDGKLTLAELRPPAQPEPPRNRRTGR